MCSHLADDDDACSKSAEADRAPLVSGTNWSYVCWSHLWLTRPGKNAKRTRFVHKLTSIFNSLQSSGPLLVSVWVRPLAAIHRCISEKVADRHCEPVPNPLERGKPQANGRILFCMYFSRVQPGPLSCPPRMTTKRRRARTEMSFLRAQRCTHPQCPS
jgi:hypothetical protein